MEDNIKYELRESNDGNLFEYYGKLADVFVNDDNVFDLFSGLVNSYLEDDSLSVSKVFYKDGLRIRVMVDYEPDNK